MSWEYLTSIPARVALAYTIDSEWRNRDSLLSGRPAIVALLTEKWRREEEYRLVKDLWGHCQTKFAVGARGRQQAEMSKPANPFWYFNSSPEAIRLVVMMYV